MQHYINILGLTLSLVYFLNYQEGKELLFRLSPVKKGRSSLKEFLLHEAGPRFTKLCNCYFCQATHIGHALSWAYGGWRGLSLAETCVLVLGCTLTTGAITSLILGVCDDLQRIADKTLHSARPAADPAVKAAASADKPNNKPRNSKDALQEFVRIRKERGYDIELVPDENGKQTVLVRSIPPRERLWENFTQGNIPQDLHILQDLYTRVISNLPEGCTSCNRQAELNAARDEVMPLIDKYLYEQDKANNP